MDWGNRSSPPSYFSLSLSPPLTILPSSFSFLLLREREREKKKKKKKKRKKERGFEKMNRPNDRVLRMTVWGNFLFLPPPKMNVCMENVWKKWKMEEKKVDYMYYTLVSCFWSMGSNCSRFEDEVVTSEPTTTTFSFSNSLTLFSHPSFCFRRFLSHSLSLFLHLSVPSLISTSCIFSLSLWFFSLSLSLTLWPYLSSLTVLLQSSKAKFPYRGRRTYKFVLRENWGWELVVNSHTTFLLRRTPGLESENGQHSSIFHPLPSVHHFLPLPPFPLSLSLSLCSSLLVGKNMTEKERESKGEKGTNMFSCLGKEGKEPKAFVLPVLSPNAWGTSISDGY